MLFFLFLCLLQVELSRLWINNIKEHIRVIKSLHSALLSSPREDESKNLISHQNKAENIFVRSKYDSDFILMQYRA